MQTDQLDVIVRVAGATLLIWAAATRRLTRHPDHRWFIPLAICLAGFLAGNSPVGELRLTGAAGRVAVIVAGFTAVFLWWWCLAVFDRTFRPRGGVLAIGSAWLVLAAMDRGVFGKALAGVGLSWLLLALGVLMLTHLAWRLFSDYRGDLLDRRRAARIGVAAFIAVQLCADVLIDFALGFDWGPQAFTLVQNGAVLAFVGLVMRLADGVDAGAHPPVRAAAPPQADRLAARLATLMEVERIHLDPGLDLAGFAAAMGASEKVVRRLIHERTGHDHFRRFLNAHRVAEARRRLSSPAHRSDKLIAIAHDSGFASLASFNRAFLEVEGRPPSAFRGEPSSEERKDGF